MPDLTTLLNDAVPPTPPLPAPSAIRARAGRHRRRRLAARVGILASIGTVATLGVGSLLANDRPTITSRAPSEADIYASLQPPSVGPAEVNGQPLRDAVTFVDCREADEHVNGLLGGSATLVQPGDQRLCYVELLDEPIRYAGAIIIDRAWNLGDHTISDAIDAGGVFVTVSVGQVERASMLGTDPSAPGGGYAQFDLDDSTTGRVVRVGTNRSQAMFSVETAAGPARVEITSREEPGDVVQMARTAYGASTGVHGTVMVAGGPIMDGVAPKQGTVTILRGSDVVLTIEVESDGSFDGALAVGQYTASATFDNGKVCSGPRAFEVGPATSATVEFLCDVRSPRP
jgi:hypothetical protein